MTIHLKQDVVADLSGTARVIDDEEERRALLATSLAPGAATTSR